MLRRLRRPGGLLGSEKWVDSHWTNVAGAQPARAVLGRTLHRAHGRSGSVRVDEMVRHGITVFRDFLAPDLFAAAVSEAEAVVDGGAVEVVANGSTTVRFFPLQDLDPGAFPGLRAWREDPRVLDLVSRLEGEPIAWYRGTPRIEDVVYGDDPSDDFQTDLHFDIVFDAYKSWLYLDDVELTNGPFVYVPGSHRFDRHRLSKEYAHSVERPRPVHASRRVSDAEVTRRGLRKEVMVVPRNTLVLANVSGYHARSVGTPGAGRRALHQSFRFDPFRRRARGR